MPRYLATPQTGRLIFEADSDDLALAKAANFDAPPSVTGSHRATSCPVTGKQVKVALWRLDPSGLRTALTLEAEARACPQGAGESNGGSGAVPPKVLVLTGDTCPLTGATWPGRTTSKGAA